MGSTIVGVPYHYHPGTDDLAFVIREHFQLPLNQRFHVLEDVGEIAWRSCGIEAQVSFLVLLQLPPPNFGRSAGHVPGATGGVQTILPFSKRVAHSEEARRHLRDHLGHFALGRSCGFLPPTHAWPPRYRNRGTA